MYFTFFAFFSEDCIGIEAIDVVEMIRFFTTLILNADESRSI